MKNAIFLFLLIASFTISTFTTMTPNSKNILNDSASLDEAPRTPAGSGTLSNGAEYNWSEDTYKATVTEIFNNDNEEKNTTSTSERTYSGEKSYLYWNETSGMYQWNEDEFTITINTNYTYWYNLTHSGNYTLKADLDIYSVNLTYGNNLELLWMALKNGTYIREYWTTYYNFNTTQSIQYMINKTFIARKVYNAINIGTFSKKGSLNHTYVPANEITSGEYNYGWSWEDTNTVLSRFETTLTAPQIYIMQTYTTEDGETVAWVNRIDNQFFIYNDTDENMIFSAGNVKDGVGIIPYMEVANEYVGSMEVGAQDVKQGSYHKTSPRDVSIEKLVSNITFSPPIETGDNKISWNITYNEYPVSAVVYDRPGGMTTNEFTYNNMYNHNATYNNMSPMNFSYQFEYEVLPQRADLDYTFEMSKITNSSFYKETQGYGLAIPYHSYFMASNEVEQTTNNDLNFAEDSIDFALGDEQVGMIDMNNPLKINYTLYNYTGTNDYDVFKSIGSTVNEQTTELEKNLDRNFMIFTLANLTRQREPLENFVDSFEIELMNYPMWSGEQLTHDPTFTALWGTKSKSTLPVPDGNDDDDNSRNGASIPFGNFYLFFIVVGIIGVVIYRRRKLKIN